LAKLRCFTFAASDGWLLNIFVLRSLFLAGPFADKAYPQLPVRKNESQLFALPGNLSNRRRYRL